MNIGRLVVGASAAFALIAGAGFAITVFGAPVVQIDEGGEMCFASREIDDGLVGVGFANTSDSSVVLDAASVGSLDGLTAGEVWVQRGSTLSDGNGIGSVDYADADQYELLPLPGTVVNPDENVRIVYRLTSTDGGGLATDFRVDYTGDYGMHHTASSALLAGFSTSDPASADEFICGE